MRIDQEHGKELMRRARVARLATADSQGQPHQVPITFSLTGGVIVTAVDHKPKSTTALKRLRNIMRNPQVSVLADHYEDDWSQLWWVRTDGTAKVADPADHPELVESLAAKYQQYRQQPPAATLIVIRTLRWNGWAASSGSE